MSFARPWLLLLLLLAFGALVVAPAPAGRHPRHATATSPCRPTRSGARWWVMLPPALRALALAALVVRGRGAPDRRRHGRGEAGGDRDRHHDRHLEQHAGGGLRSVQPAGGRQAAGRRIHPRPNRRPHRTGRLRRRGADPGPGDAGLSGHRAGGDGSQDRQPGGRHRDRQRAGHRGEPAAAGARQVQGDSAADRRREQQGADRSADGGGHCRGVRDQGVHHRRGHDRRGPDSDRPRARRLPLRAAAGAHRRAAAPGDRRRRPVDATSGPRTARR